MAPVHHAALASAEVLRLLLEHNCCCHSETTSHQTALHFSARGGNVECLGMLLSLPPVVEQVDGTDFLGRTSLHWAVLNAHTAACGLLLKAKADASLATAQTNHGRERYKAETCIQIAARTLQCNRPARRVAVFDTMMAARCDVNCRSVAGGSVLHTVCGVVPEGNSAGWEGHMAMMGAVVSRVLDAKANLHCTDNQGRTPLHVAASEGQVYAVALLLRAGADRDVVDSEGMTAAEAAERSVELESGRWPHQVSCCQEIAVVCFGGSMDQVCALAAKYEQLENQRVAAL
eukprot:TRINITY_DN45186_c0_g1_i1.p1 TRINITY_DN45186_c0_g1~~TRINITY_DN45186_c0_g1_i1.p1  ORF type:complete len:289 (-),score=43.90 TRINITY_DN45186_c0_g1_i1:162-1028(-)